MPTTERLVVNANRCCGRCALWGTKNYGDTRSCKAASKVKAPKGLPSSVRLERRFTKATEGANCPCFQHKPEGEE
jgi:hypothetical protein